MFHFNHFCKIYVIGYTEKVVFNFKLLEIPLYLLQMLCRIQIYVCINVYAFTSVATQAYNRQFLKKKQINF